MSRVSGAVTLLALALCAALGMTLLPAAATAEPSLRAVPAVEPPAVPVIAWGQCEDVDDIDGNPSRMQCATVAVPLDYDDPTGPTVDLDLLRIPASDPSRRIGSLFVNPGGPGGSSRWFAAYFGHLVPDELSRRFDVIGVDPRGVGPSAPAVCRNPDRHPPYPRVAFPTTPRQVRRQIAFDRWERRACRDGAAPIVDHMSTADTARDMDVLRQAVGDDQLTYYGVSYGAQLGATYAAMFPDHVRAMILDGVLDPVEWSTGDGGDGGQPFSERIDSGHGAWRTLTSALNECNRVGPKRCPIAGHAHRIWRDVVQRLHRRPFEHLSYADLVYFSLGALYRPDGIRMLMRQLKALHAAIFDGDSRGRPGGWLARARGSRDRGVLPGPYAPGSSVADASARAIVNTFASVACADTDNPADPHTWVRAARRADRRSPWYGAAWTWVSSICAGWPARTKADRFTGPYDVATSAPVLVVGNTFDPATPISGARAVHRLLAGSRLLELHAFGHGAIGSGPCIGRAYASYLARGVLPAPGTVCDPRKPLFPA